jgi:hypothetical protein
MAGCHDVVWLVGSRRRGKAFVEAFGPWPGRTGIPSGAAEGAAPAAGEAAPGTVKPFVPAAGGGTVMVPVGAGVAKGEKAGAAVPTAGAVGVAAVFGSSGMGFSDGAGAIDGVGERGCGCVGCGWIPACGATGIEYPLWGVIGC